MWADEEEYSEISQLPPEVLKAIEQVMWLEVVNIEGHIIYRD